MKNLFIEYIVSDNSCRQREYEDSLFINEKLEYFDNVYLITPKQTIFPNWIEFKTTKVRRIDHTPDNRSKYDPYRTTYQQIFDLPEAKNKNDINILANADIIFTDTISKIDKKLKNNIALGLSRWYLPNDTAYLARGHHMQGKAAPESNDVWIWKGECKVKNAIFPIGYYACDGRIMQCFVEAGYRVYNPAKSIVTWHNHMARPQNNPPTVPGPYWKGPKEHHTIQEVR